MIIAVILITGIVLLIIWLFWRVKRVEKDRGTNQHDLHQSQS